VLAEPPEGQGAEDGDGDVGVGVGAVRVEDVGPDDWVAVEDGVAVGEALVNIGLGRGAEGGEKGFPGGVEVIGGEAATEGGFVDAAAEDAEVGERSVAGFGLAFGQG
jgi:hypothetical protein